MILDRFAPEIIVVLWSAFALAHFSSRKSLRRRAANAGSGPSAGVIG
jgi:hypothetical protein